MQFCTPLLQRIVLQESIHREGGKLTSFGVLTVAQNSDSKAVRNTNTPQLSEEIFECIKKSLVGVAVHLEVLCTYYVCVWSSRYDQLYSNASTVLCVCMLVTGAKQLMHAC